MGDIKRRMEAEVMADVRKDVRVREIKEGRKMFNKWKRG